MEYPFPTPDAPFRPDSVPAADPDFPVRITRRAKRGLFGYLVNAQPYRGPCLRVFLHAPRDARVYACDKSHLTVTPHLLSAFGRTTARVPLSLPKLKAIHPELFRQPSAFTKGARAVLSVTTLFAQSGGSPGWMGRLVGENNPDGQAEAIETIARGLWEMPAEPAVVVSADPAVVAVYCSGFDHVLLLRVPKSHVLGEGDRLISCNGYESAGEGHPDIVHGPASFHVRNCVWPRLADPITDDTARLATLKAAVPAPLWAKARRLGEERLAAGDKPRDGRPWLSRVPQPYQGRGWYKWAGGYLR